MVKQIFNNQIEKIEYREKKVFWILFSVFVFFVLSYGLLLNSIMTKAVAKQNIEREMISIGSEVNSLESKYLNIKSKITLDFAKTRGFVVVSADKFAVIASDQPNLSLSINEN